MTLETQLQRFDEYTSFLRTLIASKGSDYGGSAETADRLANFKIAGGLMEISPSQQALSMICTKVARLTALLRDGGNPNHESIKDSCLDGSLYFMLLAMLESERQEGIPDGRVEYAPDYKSPGSKEVYWKESKSFGKGLCFSESQRDGDNHFKVKVVPIQFGHTIFEVTTCTLDIQNCYQSVRSRFGDVEYPNDNRLDFRVSAEHPRLLGIGTDNISIDGWQFRLVWEDNYVDLLWSGEIPDKGI